MARVPRAAGAWFATFALVVACGSDPASPTDAALDLRQDGVGMSSEVRSATGGAPPGATGGTGPVPGAGGASGGAPAGGSGGAPGPIPGGGGGAGGAPGLGGGTTGGSTGSGVDVQIGEDAGSAPDMPPLPGLMASPPHANFGFVTFGHVSLPIDITVSNPHPTLGTGVLAAAITGPDAAAFNATSTCPAPLAPAAMCKITVVFATDVFGPKNATLLITSGPAFAPLAVPLTGNGHQPDLGVNPEVADFGALAHGASKAISFTITNQGKGRLSGLVASLRGFAGFTLAGTCPDTLGASESCAALAVTFTSNGQGYTAGELIISARGAADPVATAPISGTGLGARLRINPSSLAVKARVGETKVVTLAVENYGTAADKPTVSLVNASPSAPFKLASDPCSTTMLAPGRSCNVTLTYRATTTETARASLRAVAPGTAAQALITGSLP